MDMKTWLKHDERTRQEIADQLGVHYITLSRWLIGQGVPSKRYIVKIRKLTKNKVTLKDFLQESPDA
jgi:transcriptional regulator with XRE-family HTH domain